jgi:hypothetical protein
MMRSIGVVCVAVLVFAQSGPSRAADVKDAKAILDKAVKALGGEQKLSNIKAMSYKFKGTISFGGNDNPFTGHTVIQDLNHFRQEFAGDFGGNQVKGVTVVAGDKGWRKFGDDKTDLDKEGLANEKQRVYLTLIPISIEPLEGKHFKVEAIGEEKVDGKSAVGIKGTGPDGKEFRLYFDKQTGLPVRLTAKVIGFMGEEYTQDTTFTDYKEIEGIKKAMKSESKRDGEKFLTAELTEFKILNNVNPKTFAEPE